MADWRAILRFDPIHPLLAAEDRAIVYFTARDLLGERTRDVQDVRTLWNLPEAQRIVRKQQADGSWKYPGGNLAIRSAANYNQLETFRNLGYLIELYGFDTSSPVISNAAEFVLSCQTEAGDIRGILGNQYTPYYTAGFLELLIKAGYADDARIAQGFAWLQRMRQDDGGWALPLRTHHHTLDIIATNAAAVEPDRSQPFSHLVTGVVLRAYAAHPDYRLAPEARVAGQLLLSNFFKSDNYPDRRGLEYWLRCSYPFWFTDLISATDSLARLGFKKEEPGLDAAIQWFVAQQHQSGLWRLKTLRNQKKYHTDLWISVAICRILRRLYADR
jgi:hypothetical protein